MAIVYVAEDDDVLQITMLEMIVDVLAVPLAEYRLAAVPMVPLPAAAASCLYTDGMSCPNQEERMEGLASDIHGTTERNR